MGWSELEGIANRGDYDLTQHATYSGKRLEYLDPDTKEHIAPYVIEPSAGVDRAVLAFLIDAYHQEIVRNEKRTVLRLHLELAPVKVAVLPLARNRLPIVEMARKIATDLCKHISAMYDDTASIGRLYRRQDEIGTPFCVTVDHQSALIDDEKYDGKVTIRERDSMEQVRVDASQVVHALKERLEK
jgi:glycyl-tRNA synthetase